MIIYQSVPKAARRFITAKLLTAFPRAHVREYYETMQLYTEQSPENLSVLFEPGTTELERFDRRNLRRNDICFGVFPSAWLRPQPGDFTFTFIRHPVDRFFSGYHHASRNLLAGTEVARPGSTRVRYRQRYPEMVALFSNGLENYVRTFLDSGGNIRFNRNGMIYGPIPELFYLPPTVGTLDFVGIVEDMPTSLARLNSHLGTNITNGTPINAAPDPNYPRWGEAALTRFLAADIATFEACRQSRG
jgi:hypothetical protein